MPLHGENKPGGGQSLLVVRREFTEAELRALERNRVISGRSRRVRTWHELIPRPGAGKFCNVHDIIIERGNGVAANSTSNAGAAGLFYSNHSEVDSRNSIATGGATDAIAIKLYLVSNLISSDAYKYAVRIGDFTVHEDTAVVFGTPNYLNVIVGDITGTFKLTIRYEIQDM